MAHEHHHPHHAHGHDHGHDPGHRHGHGHAPANFGSAFAIGVLLNAGFVVLEVGFGLAADSLALVSDAAVSLAVAAGGALVLWAGWQWIDPALTLAVSVVIVWSTWDVLRDALRLALQGVPPGIDLAAVRSLLEAQDGVAEVHDLHV